MVGCEVEDDVSCCQVVHDGENVVGSDLVGADLDHVEGGVRVVREEGSADRLAEQRKKLWQMVQLGREGVTAEEEEQLRSLVAGAQDVVYGRYARFPTESTLEALPSPYVEDAGSYCQELSLGWARVWQNARGAIEHAQKQQKHQYDRGAESTPYLVGGVVEDQGKECKLALPYHGPYCILEVRQNTLLVCPVDCPDAPPILVSMMDRVTRCPSEVPGLGHRLRRKRSDIRK